MPKSKKTVRKKPYKAFIFSENKKRDEWLRKEKDSFYAYRSYMEDHAIPFMEERNYVTENFNFLSEEENHSWFELKNYNWIIHKSTGKKINTVTAIRFYHIHLTLYTIIYSKEKDDDRYLINEISLAGPIDDESHFELLENSFRDYIEYIHKEYEDSPPYNLMFWNNVSLPRSEKISITETLDTTPGFFGFSAQCHKPSKYWFALEEVNLLSLYISTIKLKALVEKHLHIQIDIPYTYGGTMIGFKKHGDGDYDTGVMIQDYKEGEKPKFKDLWSIRGKDFKNLYNFLSWIR